MIRVHNSPQELRQNVPLQILLFPAQSNSLCTRSSHLHSISASSAVAPNHSSEPLSRIISHLAPESRGSPGQASHSKQTILILPSLSDFFLCFFFENHDLPASKHQYYSLSFNRTDSAYTHIETRSLLPVSRLL